ncbi:DUF4326 domain-containing protein [Micromonospora sp. NPDC023956]|uniref:DUF4326 domain-containing protein n=1 Tax=Micromonospora sp. NPDC023956 TaxID=3155722 RepID=UPI0033F39E35
MSTPQRIQRRRTKGWRLPENTVYVGRPGRFGNPFRAGVEFCGPTIRCLYTPTELVEQFRAWLALNELHPLFWDRELIDAHVALKSALLGRVLAGKNLACWCPLDQPCHADILLEVANGPFGCVLCKTKPATAGTCCSSHSKRLCHLCYRRTHFVEVCVAGCSDCAAENLPVTLPARREVHTVELAGVSR